MNNRVIVIDNYDSFAINLARYITLLGYQTLIYRNDQISVAQIIELNPHAIILSPGPCTPNEAGVSLECIQKLYKQFPIFGVCLGHQAIAQAFGGKIIRAIEPMHGLAAEIIHSSKGIFKGIKPEIKVARYHSLIVCSESLPKELEILAKCNKDQIMALAHRKYPIVGVQFHPESIITESAFQILVNFFDLFTETSREKIVSLPQQQINLEVYKQYC